MGCMHARAMRALEVELEAQPEQDALQRHEDQDEVAVQADAPQVQHRDHHLPPHHADCSNILSARHDGPGAPFW